MPKDGKQWNPCHDRAPELPTKRSAMAIAGSCATGVACLVCLLVPAAAWSQIYKWTDDKGGTVYSNIRPADTKKVKAFEVVMEEDKPSRISPAEKAPRTLQATVPPDIAAQQALQAARVDAVRRQQELENRVADLEQQLQLQQYQAQAGPAYYDDYGSNDSSFGYPYGYGFTYLIPSRVLPSRVNASRRIVNSGPVFAAPRPFVSPGFPGPRIVHGASPPGGASFRSGGMGTGRR